MNLLLCRMESTYHKRFHVESNFPLQKTVDSATNVYSGSRVRNGKSSSATKDYLYNATAAAA